MTPRDDATERQVQAARPDCSTWLAANAGSGKTRVLTDRVARLLLDNVPPERILCLTYTKAAASEMQNRLFQRLGQWAMLDDDALALQLAELTAGTVVSGDRLSHARTLFARAIETPGGLKIQTIHSFCASLLRRFPLEAGVSPQFSEMEDRAATLLRAEIVEELADSAQADLIDGIARYLSDTALDALTATLARMRAAFLSPPSEAEILGMFGLAADADARAPIRLALDGSEAALVAGATPILRGQSPTMVQLADALAGLDLETPDQPELERLYALFLYSGSNGPRAEAKTKSVPTKKAQVALGELLDPFHAWMERVAQAREAELALAAARKTLALHRFAAAFLPEYERRKLHHGWLDFDDLISKAKTLLNDPAVAAWVLYRLDGGIDHILVDEAQDTSPDQWAVIERLAQEFTSGLGARQDVRRTIFVVGDKKQSIYSFQGADPDAFNRMQAEFAARLGQAGQPLEDLTLEYSFRSSDAILRLVDLVFDQQIQAGFAKDSLHRAFKADLPGRVDLWPVVEKTDDTDDRDWTDPVDRPGLHHHSVVLAERIALTIRQMIEGGETIPIDGPAPGSIRRRRVRAGDFLILVQRRSDLFAEIIRACKAAGLPIAGADRLKVGAELAVKDLGALLSFLATPEDDLALATVLKSPLLGWTEQQLFDLAHRRKVRYLWQALRRRKDEFPETMALLGDLRDRADFLRPYDLIERVLTRHDGRRRLLGRLGPEAEDGINALLSQALAYERSEIPSLTGFLVWMETDDLEVKRQVGKSGNMIRVMTVHGAKGLEAPIVILPDTAARRVPKDDDIMLVDDVPVWRTASDQMPGAMTEARDTARARQMNERLRLLYVALTRAEKWLIVAAAGELSKDGDSWYQLVEGALQRANAETRMIDGQRHLRLSHGDWDAPEVVADTVTSRPSVTLEPFFHQPATAPAPTARPFNPSDLGGAKALAGELGLDEEAAKQRGTQIHLLLERLPGLAATEWPASAKALLPDLSDSARGALLNEVTNVLTDPALTHVFAPDTLAEVPIAAEIGGLPMIGVIDRLIVGDTSITAIDFKTNATVPDSAETCPDGVLRQMGAYARALEQIYPRHKIETAILWTRTGRLMPLAHERVTEALNCALRLDDTGGHS